MIPAQVMAARKARHSHSLTLAHCERCGRYARRCVCEFFPELFNPDEHFAKVGDVRKKFRAWFKRGMKGQASECASEFNHYPGQGQVAVCEHIVAGSRNPEIFYDLRNVRYTAGTVNLDLFKSNTKRLGAIRMFFPDALEYAKCHIRAKAVQRL